MQTIISSAPRHLETTYANLIAQNELRIFRKQTKHSIDYRAVILLVRASCVPSL